MSHRVPWFLLLLQTPRRVRVLTRNIRAPQLLSCMRLNTIDWNHMVISMMKLKRILQLYGKCFYSGLHVTLECRDTKLWPVSGCITMSLQVNVAATLWAMWRKTSERRRESLYFLRTRSLSTGRQWEETVVAFQATRSRNCQTVPVFPFLVVVVVAADETSQHAFDTRRKGSWNARCEL
jgi:hypothetical protein